MYYYCVWIVVICKVLCSINWIRCNKKLSVISLLKKFESSLCKKMCKFAMFNFFINRNVLNQCNNVVYWVNICYIVTMPIFYINFRPEAYQNENWKHINHGRWVFKCVSCIFIFNNLRDPDKTMGVTSFKYCMCLPWLKNSSMRERGGNIFCPSLCSSYKNIGLVTPCARCNRCSSGWRPL